MRQILQLMFMNMLYHYEECHKASASSSPIFCSICDAAVTKHRVAMPLVN